MVLGQLRSLSRTGITIPSKRPGNLKLNVPPDYISFKDLCSRTLTLLNKQSYGFDQDMNVYEKIHKEGHTVRLDLQELFEKYEVPERDRDIASQDISESPKIIYSVFYYYFNRNHHPDEEPDGGVLSDVVFRKVLDRFRADADSFDLSALSKAKEYLDIGGLCFDLFQRSGRLNYIGTLILEGPYEQNVQNFRNAINSRYSEELLSLIKFCLHSLRVAEDYFRDSESCYFDIASFHLPQCTEQIRILSTVYFHLPPIVREELTQSSSTLGPILKILDRDAFREMVLDNYKILLKIIKSKGYKRFHPQDSQNDELRQELMNNDYICYQDLNPKHQDKSGNPTQHIWLHKRFPITVRVKKNGKFTIGLIAIDRSRENSNDDIRRILSSEYREFAKIARVKALQGDDDMLFVMPAYVFMRLEKQRRSINPWDENLAPINKNDQRDALGYAHFYWK